MKSGKFWLAVLVSGVVVNILDFVLHGMILQNAYYGKMPEVFNPPGNPVWFIIGDFVTMLVFTWVYDKVYRSFWGGAKGGAMFGLYAGVLESFPTWIFMHLVIKGFPYSLSWIWTINGIMWGVIAGAVVGAIYKKAEPTRAM